MLRIMIMANSVAGLWMTSWKQPVNWKARKKKEIEPILLCGKQLHPNISCAGKVPGELVSPVGISNARPWPRNTWENNSISMVEEWTFYFHIMKARSRKAQFAIMLLL